MSKILAGLAECLTSSSLLSLVTTCVVHAKVVYCNPPLPKYNATQVNHLQAIQNALLMGSLKLPNFITSLLYLNNCTGFKYMS